MADPDVKEVIAVVGESVVLQFESEDNYAGNVDVVFTVSALDGAPGDPNRKPVPQVRWSESLPATAAGADGTNQRTNVTWTVNVSSLPDLAKRLCLVTFEASGTSAGGRPMKAHSLNRLRVPGIAITDVPILRQIMLHEFAKADGQGGFALDTDALDARLGELTIEQRKLLANYDIGSHPGGRLVVFVTFRPDPRRLMFADSCSSAPTSVRANASFAVFSCRGKGELVTLACHTDNMAVVTVYGPVKTFFRGAQKGKTPDQWLSPHNPAPPKFLVGSHSAKFTDGVVWSRIFTGKGVDIMPGNSMHGMINTIGCWMLFRNYNWPVSVRDGLFRIYTRTLRHRHTAAGILAELAAQGYDVVSNDPNDPFIDSPHKFLRCDQNHAYDFFFRHVVGIQFFAATQTFFGRFANFHNPHGLVFEKTFPKSELLTDPFLFHDVVARSKADGAPFVPPDSLWEPNALGFQTATGFLPDATWKQNLSGAMLSQRTWADVYFFKPDAMSLDAAIVSPIEAVS